MIRVVLDVRPGRAGERVSCVFCLCCFDLKIVSIRQLDDNGRPGGYLCDDCLASGEEHLRGRLRQARSVSLLGRGSSRP